MIGPLQADGRGAHPTLSLSNGFYEKAKFVKGRRGGCNRPPTTVTCAPLHLLLSALSVGRLPAARCMMRSVRTLQALQSKVRSLLRTKAICAVAKDRMFRAHVVSPYWPVIARYPSSAFNRGAELLLHLLRSSLRTVAQATSSSPPNVPDNRALCKGS